MFMCYLRDANAWWSSLGLTLEHDHFSDSKSILRQRRFFFLFHVLHIPDGHPSFFSSGSDVGAPWNPETPAVEHRIAARSQFLPKMSHCWLMVVWGSTWF